MAQFDAGQMRDYVEHTLRPLLRGDGGELVFDDYDGATVAVTLRGECSKCHIADRCLQWCGEKLLADTGVTAVFAARRQKPFSKTTRSAWA